MDTKWFVDKLADKRMSQRQLAKRMHLDSSAISLTFRGKREMKLTEAAAIAQLLGVPLDEVLQHAGVHEATKGKSASVMYLLDEHGETYEPPEKIDVEAPAGLPAGCIAIQSRIGDHTDGWLYFLMPPKGINPETVGRFSAVKLHKGVVILGTVSRAYVRNRWTVRNSRITAKDVVIDWAEPILQIIP